MLKKLLFALLPFAGIALLTSEQMSDNGKAGRTGSPGESNCTGCHGDYTVNTGGGSISLQAAGMPTFQYTAGQTYTMSVTVSKGSTNLFGIGLEALTASNDNAGTLTITDAAATSIKTATVSSISRRNIVHTLNGGASSGSKVFNFSWTAPATGTGNVTFYYAGAACNNNGNESGDYVYTGSQVFTEQAGCQPPAQPNVITGNTSVCAGASVTYSIAAVSGATSYTWTLPSGWTGTSTTTSISTVAGTIAGTISVTANSSCGSSVARTLAVGMSTLAVTVTGTNVSCHGSTNGSAAAVASGGTGPYTYSWSPSGGTAATASNLAPGTYTLTISDNTGCHRTSSVTIQDPPVLAATAGNAQATCAGTGVVLGGNPSASGGTGAYTYLWDHASDLSSATVANPTATPATSTTYTLRVTDAKGCTATSTVLVSVTTSLSQPNSITGNAAVCSGTSVTYSIAVVPGATSYTWTLPTGWSGNSTSTSISVIAGTTSGNISVTANSSCGVSPVRTLAVTASNVSITSSSTNVSCHGASNGSATVNASGGIGTFNYSWSPSGGSTATANNIAAGTYIVTISDNSNCTYAQTFNITEPDALLAYAGDSLFTCPGTGIVLGGSPTVTGGTGPYSYQWNNPSDLSSDTVSNPTANPSVSTNYTLLVSDANGCTSSSTAIVTLNANMSLAQPDVIAGDISVCSGDSVNYSIPPVSGATSYTWTLPSGWTGTSSTTSIMVIAGAASGNISVRADNNCTNSPVRNLAVSSSNVSIAASSTNISCYGLTDGSATSIASGGAGTFNYSWTPSVSTSGTASNLPAGTYIVTITDGSTCIYTKTFTIIEPPQLIASAGPDLTTCEGTGLSLGGVPAAYGGTGRYTYLWDHAADLSSDSVSNPTATPTANTDYTLLVIDSNGCSATSTVSVMIDPSPAPVLNMVGNALVSSASGSSYEWYMNGLYINNATNISYSPSSPGYYHVIVNAINGCRGISPDYYYNTVGIAVALENNSLILYPNPVNEVLNIETGVLDVESDLIIFDMTGREVLRSLLQKGTNTMNVTSLENGVYVAIIEKNNQKKKARFLVNHK